MNILRYTTLIVVVAIFTTLTGCAKFPSTPPTTGKQLVITMTVAGKIEPVDPTDPTIKRYYFIAIDNENNPNVGPWAAIYPPYGGNGWVTSTDPLHSVGLTSYIEYDASNPQGNLYGILPGSYFLNTTTPQPPIRTELLDNGSTLRFTIDFSQIATAAIPADKITQLNINFITTNMIPVDPNQLAEGRIWDGLGPSGQNYVNVDTTNNRTYSGENTDGPAVADADLDITYWSVEVETVTQ